MRENQERIFLAGGIVRRKRDNTFEFGAVLSSPLHDLGFPQIHVRQRILTFVRDLAQLRTLSDRDVFGVVRIADVEDQDSGRRRERRRNRRACDDSIGPAVCGLQHSGAISVHLRENPFVHLDPNRATRIARDRRRGARQVRGAIDRRSATDRHRPDVFGSQNRRVGASEDQLLTALRPGQTACSIGNFRQAVRACGSCKCR